MMLYTLMVFIIISPSLQFQDTCLDTHAACNSIDYQSYKNCVKSRQKRSADCNSDCSDCDCKSCDYKNCGSSCNSCCSSCCSNYMPCGTTDCCRKTCKEQCKSSSNCSRTCGKNCRSNINETNTIIVPKNDNNVNVTTVIHLNNMINTSSIVDIPIQINNNNTNVISAESFQGNSSNCCIVISPRYCTPFFRCFYYRSRLCGDFCTATIVHREKRQVCQSPHPGVTPTCRPAIIYIPQPQPKCKYESTWPYSSCGIKKSTSCAGCYTGKRDKTYVTCPSECYDIGFESGPYYRRGPFYRRMYLGDSGFEPYGYGGYGGFDRYPPYGGGFFPPPPIEFNFENFVPDGFGPATNSFEPEISFRNENDGINVGPDYFTFKGIREAEMEKEHNVNLAVPAV